MWKRLYSEEKSGISYIITFAEKSACIEEGYDVRVSRNEIENVSITTYSCNLCDYSTIDKSNMKRHIRQHTGERPYVCQYCGKSYIQKVHRDAHEFMHATLRIHMCTVFGTHLPGFFMKPSAKQTVSPTFKGLQLLLCNFCEYKTYHKTNMNAHLRKHTGERPFVCTTCRKGIQSSNASLENDMGTFLAKFKVYDCIHYTRNNGVNLHHEMIAGSSAKQFTSLAITTHACSYCNYETFSRSDLTKHLRKHTGELWFVCSLVLQQHLVGLGGEATKSIIPLKILNICLKATSQSKFSEKLKFVMKYCNGSADSVENVKNHPCPYCGYVASYRSGLINHIRKHTGERILIPTTDPGLSASNVKRNSGGPPMLSCLHCNYTTVHKSNFKAHLRKHTGERPFVCKICGKGYTSKQNLQSHEHSHALQKLQMCSICKECFRSPSSLQFHMLTHPSNVYVPEMKRRNFLGSLGARYHACKICEYVTINATDLKRHMRKHTGEKPFVCKICGKGFTSKQNHQNHEILHTQERLHMCNICKACYRSSSSLAGNQNFNNSPEFMEYSKFLYTCTYCSYATPYQTNLKNHLRKHTGEKPFVCKFCGKGFSQKHSLQSHSRLHATQKLHMCPEADEKFPVIMKIKTETLTKFSCSFCGYITPYKTTMKNHIRKHTGERPFVCDICGRDFTRKQSLQLHHASHEKPVM
ncbi:hypothetical protein TNIN_85071 [Trichonephila inaurata madagascariensis]|uniref:C2H2-type domain-containing protein n=1 Tax=Trichonephila inaurata madagascariensis TaxID=2747483 RepID=A0A8X6IZ16_9ARAC|nr:hypothetical protein TNIN_85071 [Trichonephila inaurata madagascariensis]